MSRNEIIKKEIKDSEEDKLSSDVTSNPLNDTELRDNVNHIENFSTNDSDGNRPPSKKRKIHASSPYTQKAKKHPSKKSVSLAASNEKSVYNLRKRPQRKLPAIKEEIIDDYHEYSELEMNSDEEEFGDNEMDFTITDESENENSDEPNENKENTKTLNIVIDETKIIHSPNFVFHSSNKNVPKAYLFIFNSKDPSLCYKYRKKEKNYICICCERRHKHVNTVKIIQFNGKECVQLVSAKHVCELIPYEHEKQKGIIKLPDFELRPNKNGKSNSVLLIFDSANRNMCYKYSWYECGYYCTRCQFKGKRTMARLCYDKNNEKYVIIIADDHICASRLYKPLKEENNIIIKSDMFEWQCNKYGAPKSRLVIFSSKTKNLCYSYVNSGNYWYCLMCQKNSKKYIGAKLKVDENGDEFLQLNDEEHRCDPVPYKPQREQKFAKLTTFNKIIEAPNFEIFKYKQNEIEKTRLFIFTSADRKLCYEYFLTKKSKLYKCSGCQLKNIDVKARIFLNEDETNIVKLGDSEHVCEPREYQPDKFQNDSKVYKPNYELIEEWKNGKKIKKLNIFITKDKITFYQHYFISKDKTFACSKCISKKHNVRVKICTDDDGNEYVSLSKASHVCEPINKKDIEEKEIIKLPNYKTYEKFFRGKMIKKLMVFANEIQTTGYEYTWRKEMYGIVTYLCSTCDHNHRSSVTAKLIKNEGEEEFLELGKNKHKCQPISRPADT